MANLNYSMLFLLEDGKEVNVTDKEYDGTSFNENVSFGVNLLQILIVVICILGLAGNGATIWLLGFCLEKNVFTTYIINLAIADFGVLLGLLAHTFSWILHICTYFDIFYLFEQLSLIFFLFLCNTSVCFLAAITIDRCVSLYFPLWYRCHRPKYLSHTTCAIIWIFNILYLVPYFIRIFTHSVTSILFYQSLLKIVILTLLISVSTIILVIKVCLISTKLKQKRIIKVVLFSLFAYLLFGLPMDFNLLYFYYIRNINSYIVICSFLCASINSTVNPFIYFLIANKKKGKAKESFNVAIGKVFEEENEKKNEIEGSTLQVMGGSRDSHDLGQY